MPKDNNYKTIEPCPFCGEPDDLSLIELRNDLDSVTDIEFNDALKTIVG